MCIRDSRQGSRHHPQVHHLAERGAAQGSGIGEDILRPVSYTHLIGDERNGSILLLFRVNISAGIVAIGSATGFFDYFQMCIRDRYKCRYHLF